MLSQLTTHSLQPKQKSVFTNAATCQLNLLELSARELDKRSDEQLMNIDQVCDTLVRQYLLGKMNPQFVSASVPDPVGVQLRSDDESLRIWMPENLEEKIELLSEQHEQTKSDIIRNTLLLSVYGRIRYEQWTSDGDWRPKRKSSKLEQKAYSEGEIKFSRPRPRSNKTDEQPVTFGKRTEFIQAHGKSRDGTRVFLPSQLKQQLQSLADGTRTPLSEYCRRSLVSLI